MSDEQPDPTKFHPTDCKSHPAHLQLPDEIWVTILETSCTFPPSIFSKVMLNLVKNPNVTSSHLFRADIFYDSDSQPTLAHQQCSGNNNDFTRHLKREFRPMNAGLPDFRLERTIVRQLVPRNPQVDKPLVQTCHFFQKYESNTETNVVLYIPHVQMPNDVPFYHPAVSRLAFYHRWEPADQGTGRGLLSISYKLFEHETLSLKLERTALRLLQTVHKHGQGQLVGYQKRVHLDQVIPQKRYQDTYTRLKSKYGAKLAKEWVEVTDPGKHVFEDIAIAAWLIELWNDTYSFDSTGNSDSNDAEKGRPTAPPFPGFVDIGCGNGILVSILLSEGYRGWGFDARQRKSWSIFDADTQSHLKQRLLVPKLMQEYGNQDTHAELWHDGTFEQGTFIISNHADELTLWTPLLAFHNDSAFVAIPCCSHDFSGARFRAPVRTKLVKEARAPKQRLHQKSNGDQHEGENDALDRSNKQAAEAGSLARTSGQKNMPSAYSSLCSYLESLSQEVGFEPETDVLRIPSTRNSAIVGRRSSQTTKEFAVGEKRELVAKIVERESNKTIAQVAEEWIGRAAKLSKKPSSGH